MPRFVTIVSGLPRTGTSMMMKMLEAGGMEVLADNVRQADLDNPGGYYEFEKVKGVKEDSSWLKDAEGKVVKLVSMLLYDLPGDYRYKVVFMERDMGEMLASQKKMFERMGKDTSNDDEAGTKRLYEKHLAGVKVWLKAQENMEALYVSYNDTVGDPQKCALTVNKFLGITLDVEKMAAVLDMGLYRNKAVKE